MSYRVVAAAALLFFALVGSASADWLYPWDSGGPTGDFGATPDGSDASPTARDIRAYARLINPIFGITDSFWDGYSALYGATDRTNGFQAFRMDLKGVPSSGNNAPWYIVGIDGVPGEGTSLGGYSGIDRIIATPFSGSALGTPLLFKWTGSSFDAGTPFTSITGAAWQYGYGAQPGVYDPTGYGYTLEWQLPIGQLGTGPFMFAGATVSDLSNPTIYDITTGVNLGAASLIPEPASVLLMGLGAMGLFGFAWRRRPR